MLFRSPALPFANGGTVPLGVCNPVGGTCSVPTGTAVLTIGSNPIVQAVTSSSALTVVSNNAVLNISPWDMLSIFGSNFCSSGGTGCTSSQVLYGQPDVVSYAYPNSLSPDPSGATQRKLTVTFQVHGGNTVLGTAPLMFATNSQINIIVPGALAQNVGSQVDMFVNFGYRSEEAHV